MSEATFFVVPNPAHRGENFETGSERESVVSKDLGIVATWAALSASGEYKASSFQFDKEQWANLAACEDWVRENRSEFSQFGVPEKRAEVFEAQFVQRQDTKPTREELELINGRYALKPLDADQVYVREMLLTNDQWGRHHVRLSRNFQRSIVNSMPGKSLLLGHPEAKGVPAVPEGRFFAAEEWRDNQGINWSRCKFYIVETDNNAHGRAQLDGGVWQHCSVGMETDWKQCSICGENVMSPKCKHIPGETYSKATVMDADLYPEATEQDPNKVYCGVIYRGRGSAIEGSIVYWPELKETRVLGYQTAAAIGDYGQAKRIMLGGDGAEDGQGRYVWVPEGLVNQSGNDAPPDNADIPKGQEETVMAITDEQFATLESEKTGLVTKVTGLEAEIATLNSKLDAEKPLRAARVTELERLAGIVERVPELDAFKSAFGEDLATMPAEKMLALETSWATQAAAKLPGGRQSADTGDDEDKGEKPKSATVRTLWGM